MTQPESLDLHPARTRRGDNARPSQASSFQARRRAPARLALRSSLLLGLALAAWSPWSERLLPPTGGGGAVAPEQLWLLAVITCGALLVVGALLLMDATSSRIAVGARPRRAALAGVAETAVPLALTCLTAVLALLPPLLAPDQLGERSGVPPLVVALSGIAVVGTSLARPRAVAPPANRRGRTPSLLG